MQIQSLSSFSFFKNMLLLLLALVGLIAVASSTQNKNLHLLKNIFQEQQDIPFLSDTSSIEEVLQHFQDHTIFLSVKDEAALKFPKETRAFMHDLGGDTLANLKVRDSYVGIFKNGRFLQEAIDSKQAVALKLKDVAIASAGNQSGNYSHLTLNTIEHSASSRGLNLFVVNEDQQLIGIWGFDFYKSSHPVSKASNWQTSGLEKIVLSITADQYNQLKKKRDEALKAQILLTGDEDLISAQLHFKNKNYKSEIRLKGDWTDHLQGDQWSFRVKMADSETLMGMRKFSLHRPSARNYAGEWLFHQVLAREDLMHLQYHFVNVELHVREDDLFTSIKHLGLYALEEAFGKQLIERNKRREGIILKLDESMMWEEHMAYLDGDLQVEDLQYLDFHKYKEMKILPFEEKRIRTDSNLYKQYLTGSSLFRDYIDGRKKISEVFDLPKIAKYAAIVDLLGASHALAGHNYRFYYNPVTSKLEPIGFDGNAGKKVYGFGRLYNSREDIAFLEAYTKAVEEVTQDEYVQQLSNWPGLKSMVELMQTIQGDYDWTDKMLIHNQKLLQGSIRPKQPLRVHFNGVENRRFEVSIENFSRMPIEVRHLVYKNKKVFAVADQNNRILPRSRSVISFQLNAGYEKLFTKKSRRKAGFQANTDLDKVQIQYKTIGSQHVDLSNIQLWTSDRNQVLKNDPFQLPSNANQYDFLIFDETAKTITCKAGQWNIEGKLIIPPGYTFIAGPGVQFNILSQWSAIYSYSPLQFIGTAENPIKIFSDTKMGKGLLVVQTPQASTMTYCQFNGLSNPKTTGWAVTGAVNFYEADVHFSHCMFSNNRCEDALNILRSDFTVADCSFSNIHADAFDGDFVKGEVLNSTFNNIGNDAIDVSGSDIIVKNTLINHSGDKGISAGEDSQINAYKIIVKNSEIAIASKDQSIFNLRQAVLENNKLGFTAFQKKPEFGPASILADSIEFKRSSLKHLIETNSSLILNGEKAKTVDAVIEKMYGDTFGKSSK